MQKFFQYCKSFGIFSALYIWHTLKIRPGGSKSRIDPGLWLVYSESTRQAEHVHICGTSQRVANSKIEWSWKFWPNNDAFSARMSIFSPLGGDWATFTGSNDWDPKLLLGKKIRYVVPPQLCSVGQILVFTNQIVGPTGSKNTKK